MVQDNLYTVPATPPVNIWETLVPEIEAAPLIKEEGTESAPDHTAAVVVAVEIVSPIANFEMKSNVTFDVSDWGLRGKTTCVISFSSWIYRPYSRQ